MAVNDRDAITRYTAAAGPLGGRLVASRERLITAFQGDPIAPTSPLRFPTTACPKRPPTFGVASV